MSESNDKPTIQSIAAMLSLSPMTVMRALNGNPAVGKATRLRVLAKVKELGYDHAAKSRHLRQERFTRVAIICEEKRLYNDSIFNFFMRLHYLCIKQLTAAGLSPQLVEPSEAGASLTAQDFADFGNVVIFGPYPQQEELIAQIREAYPDTAIFTVLTETDGVYAVTADEFNGGVLAAKTALALGHRQIAVISPDHDLGFIQRTTGFMGTVAAHRDVKCCLHYLENQEDVNGDDQMLLATYDQICQEHGKPTLIFLPACYYALRLASVLSRRGIVIPDEISILGYDNHEVLAMNHPSIARIGFDHKALVTNLAAAIRASRNHLFCNGTRIRIENQFYPGESLAPPPKNLTVG